MSSFDQALRENLNKTLWKVHQNGIWFRSPILDDNKKVLPPEKLARYGMDVQEAEYAILQLVKEHYEGKRALIASVPIKDSDDSGFLIDKPLEEVVGSEVIDKIMAVVTAGEIDESTKT